MCQIQQQLSSQFGHLGTKWFPVVCKVLFKVQTDLFVHKHIQAGKANSGMRHIPLLHPALTYLLYVRPVCFLHRPAVMTSVAQKLRGRETQHNYPHYGE